jgi:hypothetical protein
VTATLLCFADGDGDFSPVLHSHIFADFAMVSEGLQSTTLLICVVRMFSFGVATRRPLDLGISRNVTIMLTQLRVIERNSSLPQVLT